MKLVFHDTCLNNLHTQILEPSKLKEFADDNLMKVTKVLLKGRNTVGIGKIAHNEQFLHFPQCVSKFRE